MVKTYISRENSNVACPSCGAEIKVPSSPRNRRVQCPKCREIVVIESLPEPPPAKKERSPAPSETANAPSRPDSLEARVAALEAAVAAMLVNITAGERGSERKKLLWATADAADPLRAFMPERDQALAHNLGTVKAREIIFRAPAGDPVSAERVVSFMAIFERAGWKVRGPEEVAPDAISTSLVLGVPELPVGKEAAETYLALKAAGFDPIPVLDSTLPGRSEVTMLSLTLPGKIRTGALSRIDFESEKIADTGQPRE